jgi:hypothetical protein
MLKMIANGVLVSLKPCDVPAAVRLGFSLTAALLPSILNILYLKSPYHSVIKTNSDKEIGLS